MQRRCIMGKTYRGYDKKKENDFYRSHNLKSRASRKEHKKKIKKKDKYKSQLNLEIVDE